MAKGVRTGGRQKGVPNKAMAEVRDLAREYGAAAVRKLAELAGLVPDAKPAESEVAQAKACESLLDRRYGKSTQVIAGDAENPLTIMVEAGKSLDAKLERLIARKSARD